MFFQNCRFHLHWKSLSPLSTLPLISFLLFAFSVMLLSFPVWAFRSSVILFTDLNLVPFPSLFFLLQRYVTANNLILYMFYSDSDVCERRSHCWLLQMMKGNVWCDIYIRITICPLRSLFTPYSMKVNTLASYGDCWWKPCFDGGC